MPRPKEQLSNDYLDKSRFISSARELLRKKDSIKTADPRLKNLVYSIMNGKKGEELEKLIDEAGGCEALLDLHVDINNTISIEVNYHLSIFINCYICSSARR